MREAFLQGLTVNFLRMVGDLIVGSHREMNYSDMFEIVFKKITVLSVDF